MELIPYILAYIAIGIFVVAVVARFFMWSKMPIHIRWELYPVAHEGKRARYGGSYLEETDWWRKSRKVSLMGEVKAMAAEILFLVALKEHNPRLWRVSFPFHFGLYLVIACTLAMMGAAILNAISPTLMAGALGTLAGWVIRICAYAGLVLSLIGALGLLVRRLTAEDLRDFTSGADIFNLLFFVVAFGMSLLHLVVTDPNLTRSSFFVYSLVTFKMAALPGTTAETLMTSITVVLMGLLVAYIPLTHMSHFVGKYFAYHAIRWNDAPNTPGSKHEKPIMDVLQYPVSWAAAHIQGDGKKTWADVATDISSAQEEQKK